MTINGKRHSLKGREITKISVGLDVPPGPRDKMVRPDGAHSHRNSATCVLMPTQPPPLIFALKR